MMSMAGAPGLLLPLAGRPTRRSQGWLQHPHNLDPHRAAGVYPAPTGMSKVCRIAGGSIRASFGASDAIFAKGDWPWGQHFAIYAFSRSSQVETWDVCALGAMRFEPASDHCSTCCHCQRSGARCRCSGAR